MAIALAGDLPHTIAMSALSGPMAGKVCMVTGANRGIGLATALGLAKKGATVVLVCRSVERGRAAADTIIAESGNPSVQFMQADLSSQQSIRDFVEEFKRRYDRLHVLINNAGLAKRERALTAEGEELTLAVNHLAPFLLTHLLLDVLKANAPSRIVNVASFVHKWGKIDFANLHGEKKYGANKAYYQSKLANVLFTRELSRRLHGTGVTANACNPGIVATDFDVEYKGLSRFVSRWVFRPFKVNTDKGAETSLYLASSPEVEGVTGGYFIKKRPAGISKAARDLNLAARLWDASAELTGLARQAGKAVPAFLRHPASSKD